MPGKGTWCATMDWLTLAASLAACGTHAGAFLVVCHLRDLATWCVCIAGQTAYGYANSCMELLCQQRRADGLPAVSIQWPIIAHIGVAASKEVSCPHAA